MPSFGHCIPIFNAKNIAQMLKEETLSVDDQGLFRPLETVVLPGEIVHEIERGDEVSIIEVPKYDPEQKFYTLTSFLQNPVEYHSKVGDLGTSIILKRLKSYLGAPYVWGGNWIYDEIQKKDLESTLKMQTNSVLNHLHFLCSGVDCSGLLYAATFGCTPRNTSKLVFFGDAVLIEGMSAEEISRKLEPLDLVVWKGHVLISLDHDHLIESLNPNGVVLQPTPDRLREIMNSRKPMNNYEPQGFVVRRWVKKISL